jgi:thiol:disulfide interchange protein DsbC
MQKVLFSVIILFLLLPILHAYGSSESLGLTEEEASTILGNLDPNIKVIGVKTSPVEGLWEIDIEAGGKKSLVYIDFSKKYLISGSIISIQEKKNLTQERITEINKVDVSKIPLDDALVMGDREAKYRIIVFDDPD